MQSKDFQVLHYETVVNDDTKQEHTTAEVLELVDNMPNMIYVVPVIGMKLPPNPTRSVE